MDFKFQEPKKETKNRSCFRCNKHIQFKDFCFRNRYISGPRRIKLWENPLLEFYCCMCYDEIFKSEKTALIKKKINLGDAEVVRFLESSLNMELPIVRKIDFNTVGIAIKNKRIVGLGLYKVGLKDIPEYLSELDNLIVLNLAWNSISELSDCITSMKKLRTIDLIGNELDRLPPSIVNLISLEEIDLSFNFIKEIPAFVSEIPRLNLLKLFKNRISFISESVLEKESKGLKILL